MLLENEIKISRAKQLKEEGNELFKAESYKKARIKYAQALAYTKGLPGRESKSLDPMTNMAANSISNNLKLEKKINEELDSLDCILKTNIATCYLKLGDGAKALQISTDASNLDKSYWKASLRRGEAALMLRDSEKALGIFNEALLIPGVDLSARNAINKAKNLALKVQAEEIRQQREAFAGIFNRNSK